MQQTGRETGTNKKPCLCFKFRLDNVLRYPMASDESGLESSWACSFVDKNYPLFYRPELLSPSLSPGS